MKKLLMIMMVATLGGATVSAQKPAKATSVATQCIAKTQKGTRCKLEIVKGSKYCPIHQPLSKDKQCKAKTKKRKEMFESRSEVWLLLSTL